MTDKNQFTPKPLQSQFGRTMVPVLQMTEELLAKQCAPYAMIGFTQPQPGKGMEAHLSLISDDDATLQMMLTTMKGMLESKAYVVISPLTIIKP